MGTEDASAALTWGAAAPALCPQCCVPCSTLLWAGHSDRDTLGSLKPLDQLWHDVRCDLNGADGETQGKPLLTNPAVPLGMCDCSLHYVGDLKQTSDHFPIPT